MTWKTFAALMAMAALGWWSGWSSRGAWDRGKQYAAIERCNGLGVMPDASTSLVIEGKEVAKFPSSIAMTYACAKALGVSDAKPDPGDVTLTCWLDRNGFRVCGDSRQEPPR